MEHAEEMAAALADLDLHTFIGGAPADPQALRARYERLVAGSPDPTASWCNWMIQLHDEACLIGTVQATVTGPAHERIAEITWVVGTPWQGRGIATEATRGVVAWHERTALLRFDAGLAVTKHDDLRVGAARDSRLRADMR